MEAITKQIIKHQQAELDAVLLYRKLSALMKDKQTQKLLLQIAADEGKHAAILKNISGKSLKPKAAKAHFICGLYRLCGLNTALNLMIKGELDAVPVYQKLLSQYPQVVEIMKDESRHAAILEKLKSK